MYAWTCMCVPVVSTIVILHPHTNNNSPTSLLHSLLHITTAPLTVFYTMPTYYTRLRDNTNKNNKKALLCEVVQSGMQYDSQQVTHLTPKHDR